MYYRGKLIVKNIVTFLYIFNYCNIKILIKMDKWGKNIDTVKKCNSETKWQNPFERD